MSNADSDPIQSSELSQREEIMSLTPSGTMNGGVIGLEIEAEGEEIDSNAGGFSPAAAQSLEKLLVGYLEKKGFYETLRKLVEESREQRESSPAGELNFLESDASIVDYLLSGDKVFDPENYFRCYLALKSWIDDSLEIYKPELRAFLYPLFIHSYLDLVSKSYYERAFIFYKQNCEEHMAFHSEDLRLLSSIKTPNHVKESSFSLLFRENKYGLKISKVGFELLIAYLQDNQLLTTLRLINDYLSIQVVPAIPGTGELIDPIIGLTGHENSQLKSFHEQPTYLGHPPPTQEFKTDIEQLLKEEDSYKKRKLNKSEVNNFTSLLDQYKEHAAKKFADGYSRDEIPLPPSKGTDVLRSIQELKDISQRVKLIDSTKSMASICFYTLHNANERVCNINISNNLSLMAIGSADSYIKLYSLKGEKLRNVKSNFNPTMVNEESDLDRMREKSGSEFKMLVGHSGPVYGLSFSPCSKYLLSSSEDGTVRLWNTLTFSCLICYRGHNYPVWDVDFSPNGIYFVTGSHDRTARLWSTEHPNPLRVFAGHISDIDCVKFHPNGRYVITGSSDKTARLWDIANGKCLRVFTGHTGPIESISISNDGRILATAGSDNHILVWDISTGKLLYTLQDTKGLGTILSLTFSQEGEALLSGSSDGKVRIWDTKPKDNKESEEGVAPPLSNSVGLETLQQRPDQEDRLEKKSRLVNTFPTKNTLVLHLKCTPRNLILGVGTFIP